ncbi:MAG: TonB-dependent siderophore receptor [Acidovorax sp.]|uniref:TonB-dependent siderophore receptor n=1 Tax=Acidovorax sp. TaxID=1872122 RepID=UPI00391BF4B3
MRRQNLRPAPVAFAIALLLGAQAVYAQGTGTEGVGSAPVQISISAQPLAEALNDWARQTRIQLIVQQSLVVGKTAPAVAGYLAPMHALERLLAGSGLAGSIEGSAVIVKAGQVVAEPATNTLGEVRISSSAAEPSYREEEASGATKISAPLRDLPVSIQVLPRAVIDDQSAIRTEDVVLNASGINIGAPSTRSGDNLIFRGFSTSEFLRDGMPDRRRSMRDMANIEQIEVLKGPASVLYGRIEPGGTLNYVTKRPLYVKRYEAAMRVDNYGLVRPSVDLSTVSEGGAVGVRLNAALEHGGNYRDYSFSNRKFVSGAVGWRLTRDTDMSFELESLEDRRSNGDDMGIPFYRGAPAPIPLSRLLSEPEHYRDTSDRLFGYTINHRLDSTWKFKHALRYTTQTTKLIKDNLNSRSVSNLFVSNVDPVTGKIGRNFAEQNTDRDTLTAQAELVGDLRLFSMRHQVLFGAESDRIESTDNNWSANAGVASNDLDIFNPVYGRLSRQGLRQTSLSDSAITANALYFQDLIDLAPQWKALIGARYDRARNTSANRLNGSSAAAESSAVSPRAGIVWQPTTALSMYGSYSESFVPVIGQDFFGSLFKPTTGKQVELGVKSDWFDGKLSASAAIFSIKKGNVSAPDPDHDGFNIQTGEITSDGIEFDIAGSPLRGMNVIANLSVIDARISKETRASLIGVRPSNTAEKTARLWVSYELQDAALRGWGGGFGGTYVGDRVNSNSQRDFHTVPSYVRWDAGIWYRAANWRIALKLENVTDKVYYVSSNNLVLSPGAPRNLSVTASYRF